MTLPYHSGITEPLARILRQKGISTSINSRGTLREHLVHPKDKIEALDINGVVYFHGCAGHNGNPCEDCYVGESGRAAAQRNTEHFSTAQSAPGLYKSAIMQHAADNQHHFRTEDIKILSKEERYFERGVRESVAIRAIAPSLNRNEGRHQLSHRYDTIVRNTIKKPEPPEPHDPSEPLLNTARRPPGRPRAQPSVTEEQTAAKTIAPSNHQSSTTIDDNQTTAKTIAPTNQRSNHHMTTRSRATQS